MNKPLFITGIGTGIGKTVASAIFVESLKADYWKPIQSGDLDNSDTLKVKSLVANSQTVFHPEAYRLTQPYSPHKSAALDGIVINPLNINIPNTDNQLIIEGAGGLMVPLNDNFLMVDLIQQLGAEVILVVKHYLGSINHTLLSLDALRSRDILIKAVVYNGDTDEYSEDIINKYARCKTIRIPELSVVDKETITKHTISL